MRRLTTLPLAPPFSSKPAGVDSTLSASPCQAAGCSRLMEPGPAAAASAGSNRHAIRMPCRMIARLIMAACITFHDHLPHPALPCMAMAALVPQQADFELLGQPWQLDDSESG